MRDIEPVRISSQAVRRLESRTFAFLNSSNSSDFLNSLNLELLSQNYCQYQPALLISSINNKGRLVLRPLVRIRDSRCK
jgi:hypothetical protein